METIKDIPMEIVVIIDGERFTRLPVWWNENIPSKDFKRVDGGYNATEEQLAHLAFEIETV